MLFDHFQKILFKRVFRRQIILKKVWARVSLFSPTGFYWKNTYFSSKNSKPSSYTNLAQFTPVWTNSEPIWTISEPIWANLSQLWMIWTNFNQFWPFWTNFDQFWPFWINFEHFLSTLTILNQIPPNSTNSKHSEYIFTILTHFVLDFEYFRVLLIFINFH